MSTIAKKLAAIAVGVLLSGLVFLAVLSLLGLRQRARAEAFLIDVTKLKLGVATFAEAERLSDRYGGKPWSALPQGTRCTADECYLYFSFPNPRNIFPFVLVSRVAFGGIIHVRDDRVIGIELVYQIDSSRFVRGAGYDVKDTLLEESPAAHYQRYRWASPGFGVARLYVDQYDVPWVVEVRLNARSTAAEKKRAFSFNFSCLAKLYGCTTPSAIFPPGWQD
jgi:hypothetical protein